MGGKGNVRYKRVGEKGERRERREERKERGEKGEWKRKESEIYTSVGEKGVWKRRKSEEGEWEIEKNGGGGERGNVR